MKSDVIVIDNQGNGFRDAVEQTKRTAAFRGLNSKDSLHLQLITEEMLSLARSVTGEMKASFWIEGDDNQFDLHLSTETVMDKEKRALLISSATNRKNDAAKGFLGKLRDAFEQAMVADAVHPSADLPPEILADIPATAFEDADWDGYEKSVLKRLADNVKIGIRGSVVDMTVSKKIAG
ncbi:MAG: hypothetical protein IJJ42_10795 [Clostridia bacterium]|nr:hypothetical protein [Clostridia bacterium]